MHDINAALVDEEMCHVPDLSGRLPGVIRAPVDGEDLQTWFLCFGLGVRGSGEEGFQMMFCGKGVVDEVEFRDDGPVAWVVRG